MRYLALACDYDGTLARDGVVGDNVVDALARLRESGRKLILVTGRELDDLCTIFEHVDLFDRVVAENGAVLYCPETKKVRLLTEEAPGNLVDALRKRNVKPLSVGRAIVATWHPNETQVLQTIEELGLERQIIFNKGAVMVLPSGVNKASGLDAALAELALSPHNVAGVGDAENDHAFLSACECSVVVANALPALKDRADYVTRKDHGDGVVELIDRLLADDLRDLEPYLGRHEIELGKDGKGEDVRIKPYGINVLVTGTSGSGKSTITTGILERLAEAGYQFFLVDPEGDYTELASAVLLGDSDQKPIPERVMELVEDPSTNVGVNLLAIPMPERPDYFSDILSRLEELRRRSGRPHWIAVDEAHHMLGEQESDGRVEPGPLVDMLLVTVHPDHVSPTVLEQIETVIAVGKNLDETLGAFASRRGVEAPHIETERLGSQDALVWDVRAASDPVLVHMTPPKQEMKRHQRKYAAGELAPEKSFYFRGPEDRLNLRAQNLMTFVQMGEGVDDETWLFHLHRGDYSTWFREMIGDEDLAVEAEEVERQKDISASDSRSRIKQAVEKRYTAPE